MNAAAAAADTATATATEAETCYPATTIASSIATFSIIILTTISLVRHPGGGWRHGWRHESSRSAIIGGGGGIADYSRLRHGLLTNLHGRRG